MQAKYSFRFGERVQQVAVANVVVGLLLVRMVDTLQSSLMLYQVVNMFYVQVVHIVVFHNPGMDQFI